MRNALLALLAALLLAAPCRAQTGALPPEEPGLPPGYVRLASAQSDSVLAVLRGYLDAIHRHDGAAATQAVTRGTRAYYAQMRDLALTAPEAKVRSLPLMDRLSVLMYRHRVAPEVLRTLTGDAAFAHTISDGWVDRTARQGSFPTLEVYANGDQALLRDGALQIRMVREDGAWRWDMMPMIRSASAEFAGSIPAGMKEDEFIFLVLSNSNGLPVSPSVWQPVQ
ncbi:MAG TPA: hypothetical protein VJT67_11750 [Longimicrobiaceae bacterium]|nr:hypothetical protein [Longimicrobiaceae bacterium]